MWTRQYRRSPLRHAVIPTIAAVALAYYGFHGVNGNLGLQSKQEYETRLAGLQADLAVLSAERALLETRTQALSDGALQRDMIDEQARLALGLTQANEVILLHSDVEAAASMDQLLQRTN